MYFAPDGLPLRTKIWIFCNSDLICGVQDILILHISVVYQIDGPRDILTYHIYFAPDRLPPRYLDILYFAPDRYLDILYFAR